jgi:hypothetical protein
MNKKQWMVLAWGLVILGIFLYYVSPTCRMGVDDITSQSNYIGCIIGYQIGKFATWISVTLGVLFGIIANFEKKK